MEKGYLIEIEQLDESTEDIKMTREEYDGITDILRMFNDLQWSYANLDKQTALTEDEVIFKGFDATFEGEQYEYAEFLLKEKNSEFVPKRAKDRNSHAPKLGHYMEMLSKWKGVVNREAKNLSLEQISQIIKP